eukprot:12764589-Ditylum_brightwellii.AAC.1
MESPVIAVGMLLFSGCFRMCLMSDIACLMASSSLKDGIGVLYSMSLIVSASTSAVVSGM